MILEQIKNPDFFNNSEQNMIYFLQNNLNSFDPKFKQYLSIRHGNSLHMLDTCLFQEIIQKLLVAFVVCFFFHNFRSCHKCDTCDLCLKTCDRLLFLSFNVFTGTVSHKSNYSGIHSWLLLLRRKRSVLPHPLPVQGFSHIPA